MAVPIAAAKANFASMVKLPNCLAGLCEESLAAALAAPTLKQRIAFLEAAIWFADGAYRALGNIGQRPGIQSSKRHPGRS